MMPLVLLQTLYVDLFGQGLDVALTQIVDITSGRNIFKPGPQEFSNLRAIVREEDGVLVVECRAEFYLEPISSFLFLVLNDENELEFECLSSGMTYGRFNKNVKLDDGRVFNCQGVRIERPTTPGFPFVEKIKPKVGIAVKLAGVMHEKSQGRFNMIPFSNVGQVA
jgi:hypothetical protein